jgi:malonate-semialdehyde dehydrogenase (acetylating)/methylmalonate-semialdehyde dehydrogenase
VQQNHCVLCFAQIISSSKTWYDIHNPATNEVVARVPETTKEELNAAVASSKKAFESWKEVSAQQRARVMMKFHALLNQHKDEIAALITQEQGKTLADAHGDLYRGIEVLLCLACFFFFFFSQVLCRSLSTAWPFLRW